MLSCSNHNESKNQGGLRRLFRRARLQLFPTPVWHVGAGAGKSAALRTVGQHSPNLHVGVFAVGGVSEDDMTAVGRPGGEVAGAYVVGELNPALGGDLHDVDVTAAGGAGAVLAIPCEGEEVSVG